jgi:hypothetical protein
MSEPENNNDVAYLATEMVAALKAAEKADTIHSKCEECMETGQAAEACGECFPSADDARVLRRNVLAKVGLAMRRAKTRVDDLRKSTT